MSVASFGTVERSDPFVNHLIQQSRGEAVREGLAAAELLGKIAVPALVTDPRDVATQLMVIGGGAASGKSTLAEDITCVLEENGVSSAIISSDDFVRFDREERHNLEATGMTPEEKYSFDALRRAIADICANRTSGKTVAVPQYDSHTGFAVDGTFRRHIPRVGVLIVEGDVLGEQGKRPQDLYPDQVIQPVAMYVHVPDEVRRDRRIERDIHKRNAQGATPEDIARSFERRQESQHVPYTLQYAAAADLIVKPTTEAVYGPRTYDMYAMPTLRQR